MALLYHSMGTPERARPGLGPAPPPKHSTEAQKPPPRRSTSSNPEAGPASGSKGRSRSYSASTGGSDKASKRSKEGGLKDSAGREEFAGSAGRNRPRSKSHSRSASARSVPSVMSGATTRASSRGPSSPLSPRGLGGTGTSMSANAALLSYLEEQLFALSKIPVGDFESIMAWVELHSANIDYRLCREKMLWQTYKTFERLLKRDFEERHVRLVQEFANQCVQTLAILDYAADCGYENLRKYVRNLVLTPEMARMSFLNRMLKLSPQERLEFITRPVPGHLEKLKWFCLLYDHLYEKIELEAKHRMEKTLLDKFHTRLENVQARLSRGANTLLNSPGGANEVGRAL